MARGAYFATVLICQSTAVSRLSLRWPTPAALRRRRCRNDVRVQDHPGLQPMPEQGQVRGGLPERRLAQPVPLQQVVEVRDRRLVRKRTRQQQPTGAAPPQPRRQIFHAGIARLQAAERNAPAASRRADAAGDRDLPWNGSMRPSRRNRKSGPSIFRETSRVASAASSSRAQVPQGSTVSPLAAISSPVQQLGNL